LKSFLDPPDQPRKRRLTFITTPPVKRGAFTGRTPPEWDFVRVGIF
jgi:hypothetical protein